MFSEESTQVAFTESIQEATSLLPSIGCVADYWKLTKPRINFLIAISTITGFIAAVRANGYELPRAALLHTVVGTLFLASGTNALNQYLEREYDAQMVRTAQRPLPAGRINAQFALWFAVLFCILGVADLYIGAHPLSALIAAFTSLTYLIIYTPLKRITPLSVSVGAIAGATPPLIGWAGATNSLGHDAWLLFLLQFLWQFPHFMAIAWLYSTDYKRAGYKVLPKNSANSSLVSIQTLLPSVILVGASFMAVPARTLDLLAYRLTATGLAIGFMYCVLAFVRSMCPRNARILLLASIVYLPLLFVLRIVV
jgi:heme o synthase